MADELKGVRSKFVDKVPNELIKELLDDLFDDGVLSDGQRDSILEVNLTRKDKARELIDTVRRKGDVASRKMIAHLEKRDLTLHSELGLSSGQPAQPAQPAQLAQLAQPAQPALAQLAAEPQVEQEWSTTLIDTTEAFWVEKQNNGDTYPAAKKSLKYRVALLITNIKFTDGTLNRNGAARDEENMYTLLTELGYEVVKRTNLTGKEMNDAVIEFSKHMKLKQTDSVMVVIMSHGKLGAVLGVDWKNEISGDEKPDEFPINNIYQHLGSERCPALLNKPKIIIIQACRGDKGGSVMVADGIFCDDASQSAGGESIEEDSVKFVNREKDFLSLLSCTPDTVSYRQPDHGSFLIQYVVDVLNTFAHKDDIEELFRKVMLRFEKFPVFNKKQMATKDRVTLTKRFYFFPGL